MATDHEAEKIVKNLKKNFEKFKKKGDWTQGTLSEEAKLAYHTIAKIESGYTCHVRGPKTSHGRAVGPLQVLVSSAENLGVTAYELDSSCAMQIEAGVRHMEMCIKLGARTQSQFAACHVSGNPFNKRLSKKAERYRKKYVAMAIAAKVPAALLKLTLTLLLDPDSPSVLPVTVPILKAPPVKESKPWAVEVELEVALPVLDRDEVEVPLARVERTGHGVADPRELDSLAGVPRVVVLVLLVEVLLPVVGDAPKAVGWSDELAVLSNVVDQKYYVPHARLHMFTYSRAIFLPHSGSV